MKEKRFKGRKWSKVGIVLVTALIVIFSGIAIAYGKTDLREAVDAHKENHTEAEKQGLTVTLNLIGSVYTVPEYENGANLVSQAHGILIQNQWDEMQNITEKMVRGDDRELEMVLAKLDDASKRKHLIFRRDLTNPLSYDNAQVRGAQLQNVDSVVRFLTRLAHFAADRSDLWRAKKCLDMAASISGMTDEDGTVLATLARVEAADLIHRELRSIIERHGKSKPWRDEVIESALVKLDRPYDIKRMVRIEHCFATSVIDRLLTDPKSVYSEAGEESPTPVAMALPKNFNYTKLIPTFKKANQSRIDEAFAAVASKLRSDNYNAVEAERAFDEMETRAHKDDLSYMLLSVVAPSFSSVNRALATESAYRNALFQSLQILKTGQNPQNGLPLKDRIWDSDGSKLRLVSIEGKWIVSSTRLDMQGNKSYWDVQLPM